MPVTPQVKGGDQVHVHLRAPTHGPGLHPVGAPQILDPARHLDGVPRYGVQPAPDLHGDPVPDHVVLAEHLQYIWVCYACAAPVLGSLIQQLPEHVRAVPQPVVVVRDDHRLLTSLNHLDDLGDALLGLGQPPGQLLPEAPHEVVEVLSRLLGQRPVPVCDDEDAGPHVRDVGVREAGGHGGAVYALLLPHAAPVVHLLHGVELARLEDAGRRYPWLPERHLGTEVSSDGFYHAPGGRAPYLVGVQVRIGLEYEDGVGGVGHLDVLVGVEVERHHDGDVAHRLPDSTHYLGLWARHVGHSHGAVESQEDAVDPLPVHLLLQSAHDAAADHVEGLRRDPATVAGQLGPARAEYADELDVLLALGCLLVAGDVSLALSLGVEGVWAVPYTARLPSLEGADLGAEGQGLMAEARYRYPQSLSRYDLSYQG